MNDLQVPEPLQRASRNLKIVVFAWIFMILCALCFGACFVALSDYSPSPTRPLLAPLRPQENDSGSRRARTSTVTPTAKGGPGASAPTTLPSVKSVQYTLIPEKRFYA